MLSVCGPIKPQIPAGYGQGQDTTQNSRLDEIPDSQKQYYGT
jgi:hypothetical protein